MRKHFGLSAAAAAVALTLPLLASAQVKVGVTVSSTGPAASLGIPERNTVALLPKEVAGQKIEWIVLDDATDTTQAVKNSRKLASDDKVDVLIGTSVTPGSLAMVDVAAEAKVPMISVAASAKIVEPVDDKRRWVFKTPQNDALMAGALADAMSKSKVKTLGFIGFADAYGDGWLDVMQKAAKAKGIEIVSIEKYSRTDTSVTGQVLKLIGAKPDAILINAARGGIMDEAALVAALKGGRLGGAALDVFEQEPLKADGAKIFAGTPNLILTPHIAGNTVESNGRVSGLVAERVMAALEGWA